jgi:hypothetical protein
MSAAGPLPAGWEEYATAGGECYYFNSASNETTWERPTVPERAAAPAAPAPAPAEAPAPEPLTMRGNPLAGGIDRTGMLAGITGFDKRKLSAASAGAEAHPSPGAGGRPALGGLLSGIANFDKRKLSSSGDGGGGGDGGGSKSFVSNAIASARQGGGGGPPTDLLSAIAGFGQNKGGNGLKKAGSGSSPRQGRAASTAAPKGPVSMQDEMAAALARRRKMSAEGASGGGSGGGGGGGGASSASSSKDATVAAATYARPSAGALNALRKGSSARKGSSSVSAGGAAGAAKSVAKSVTLPVAGAGVEARLAAVEAKLDKLLNHFHIE